MSKRRRILEALDATPRSAREVAAVTGLRLNTVSSQLSQLATEEGARIGRQPLENGGRDRWAYFRLDEGDPDAPYRLRHRPDPMAPLFLDWLRAHR